MRTCLVVDDSSVIRKVARRILEGLDFQILEAEDGEQALEIVDTPGLNRKQEGNASRLASIREAGCLLHVLAAFDGSDFQRDLAAFEEDLLLADFEIITGRVERLRDSVRKPRPNRDEQLAELTAIEPILETLEAGQPLSTMDLSKDQLKVIRSFQLLTQKQRLALINVADDEQELESYAQHATAKCAVIAVPVGLELELARMALSDRDEFRQEMGLKCFDQHALIRTIMDASGQMLFFTAGDKEVRTWMIRQGSTAVEAADSIHSDLARGFIRAETMSCQDLVQLGSEREVKANNRMRQEPKDYVVQDGDILNIRFSV